jgi:hypothetical protein
MVIIWLQSGEDGKCLSKVKGPKGLIAEKGDSEREGEERELSKSTSLIDLLTMNISRFVVSIQLIMEDVRRP